MEEKNKLMLKLIMLFTFSLSSIFAYNFYKNNQNQLHHHKNKIQKSITLENKNENILNNIDKKKDSLPIIKNNIANDIKNNTEKTISEIKDKYIDQTVSNAQKIIEDKKQEITAEILDEISNIFNKIPPKSESVLFINCPNRKPININEIENKKILIEGNINSIKSDNQTYIINLSECKFITKEN